MGAVAIAFPSLHIEFGDRFAGEFDNAAEGATDIGRYSRCRVAQKSRDSYIHSSVSLRLRFSNIWRRGHRVRFLARMACQCRRADSSFLQMLYICALRRCTALLLLYTYLYSLMSSLSASNGDIGCFIFFWRYFTS